MEETEDEGFVIIIQEEDDRQKQNEYSQCYSEVDPPKYLSEISTYVESLQSVLWSLNSFIHSHPELAFKEYQAHNALTSFMGRQPNWAVTKSAYGLETAWEAVYESGQPGPAVSFNVEMDALPDLGHACGHNLIATASVTAALATSHIMKTHGLPGRIHLFGTPGEEGHDGGKIKLLQAGAYDDISVTLISHPGILHNSALVRTTAFCRLEVEYFGKAAHGAASPWEGINALDALVNAYNAVSMLRQQTMPGDIIGMHITHGGSAPNIIHAYAAGAFVLRSQTAKRLGDLKGKVEACLRAGAEATGARVSIKVVEGYKDHVPNIPLAASYTSYFTTMPEPPPPRMSSPTASHFTYIAASTDQGDLSYALPSINASFSIEPPPEGGGPHSRGFEAAAGTRGAFERALRVGVALAGTAVDVLASPKLLVRIREAFEKDMQKARPTMRVTADGEDISQVELHYVMGKSRDSNQ